MPNTKTSSRKPRAKTAVAPRRKNAPAADVTPHAAAARAPLAHVPDARVPGAHASSEHPLLAPSSAETVRIRRLRREELPHDTIALTRFLIGKIVVHDLPMGRLSGRIVEAEAYPPGDPAGHHFRGPTPRIRSMYKHPGHAYIYFNYGVHFMLNIASEPAGTAGGILIRALEPLEGIALMQAHRKTTRLLDLTRGPGRLASALQIDRRHDGIDLCSPTSKLWLGEWTNRNAASDAATTRGKRIGAVRIGKTVRIGITRAADRLLRFYEIGNPHVSGPKRLLR